MIPDSAIAKMESIWPNSDMAITPARPKLAFRVLLQNTVVTSYPACTIPEGKPFAAISRKCFRVSPVRHRERGTFRSRPASIPAASTVV